MRTSPRTSRIAFAAGGASTALTLVSVVVLVVDGQQIIGTFVLALIALGLTFPAVGALVAARQPGNRVGWVILLGSFFYAVLLFVNAYARYVFTGSAALPGGALAAWIGAWVWIPSLVLLLVVMPLIFPDGRLPSRRWRWIAGLIVIGSVTATATQAIGLWGLDPADLLLGTEDLAGPIGYLSSIGLLVVTIVGPLAATGAVVVRLRRSAGVEREQMRWFAYAITMVIACLVFGETVAWEPAAIGSVVFTIAILLIPIAIGIAILRYRLYDIDRIISRTVSYAIVTGVLAVVFVGAVFVFQAILAPVLGDNPVGVAASTLIVAALFQPLRRRVQRVVDRRFDRSRYDAERTLAIFSARLRDDVDLASLSAEISEVVRQTVAPTSLGLWMRRSKTES